MPNIYSINLLEILDEMIGWSRISERGANPWREYQPIILPYLPENCMKLKKFGWEGGCKSQICPCRYATGDEHRKRKNCTFFIRWHWKLRYSFKTVWSQKQMKAWYYRCGSRIPHRAPSLCYKCLWKCDSKCGLEMSLELSALFDAALLHHKHINFKRFELFAIKQFCQIRQI